jgi:2-oxoglutarate dehydrogenase E1 component
MANFQDSYLFGGNIDFIEGLYARYLEDPSSVDPSWRELFARNDGAGRPIFNKTLIEPPAPVVPGKEGKGEGKGSKAAAAVALAPQTAPTVAFEQDMKLQARVDQAISAFRLRGHLRANLDPLGRSRPAWTTWPTWAWWTRSTSPPPSWSRWWRAPTSSPRPG